MKNYRMINVETNDCIASGNIAYILECFKGCNYPNEVEIIDEDNAITVSSAVISGRRHEDTIKRVEDLIKGLCKRCSKCGRLLPKEAFNKKTKSSDGLQDNCKDCTRAYNKERYDRMKLHKVFSNPDLARFTPRELMAELKARGFKWEYMLEPQKKIMFDKI